MGGLKCFTRKSPAPSMATSKDLKIGCKALQTPGPAPETADSHTARPKCFATFLCLLSPLHRLKLHQSRQSWNGGPPPSFNREGKLRHRWVLLPQTGDRGVLEEAHAVSRQLSTFGNAHDFCLHRPLSS